ncbi:hypothetical protein IC611_01165 [Proteus mirabilis]
MDEFKPENEIKSGDNSLKPDTSDRPERRTNRPRNNPLKMLVSLYPVNR